MFSKEFTRALALAQHDTTPQHLAAVLGVLWSEVERLERIVSIGQDEITLTTGDASVVLKKDGSIVISGTHITVKSSRETTVRADGELVLKGSRVLTN